MSLKFKDLLMLGAVLGASAIALPQAARATPVTGTVAGTITGELLFVNGAPVATGGGLIGTGIDVTYSYDPSSATYTPVTATSDGIANFPANSVSIYATFGGTTIGVTNDSSSNTYVVAASQTTATGTIGQLDIVSTLDAGQAEYALLDLVSTDSWVQGAVTSALGKDFALNDQQAVGFIDGNQELVLTFAVPEPASMALLGAGLLGLIAARRRTA